ncbi:YifB family Mg chelatase-like AAA ATPase [Sulfurihydrogenibium sp.]|jgi:magnesium chelatase family protein|uniref:YifB family Mg chelatase-like AAA ATPase n=1 Tax=Sulfurihydrogenibium sp. TaxID=2053621 RepID=UPI002614D88C|nr:YifB family Mg chelatase-like AAA ATPase [Sulfurihydrogenibium sp.]
MLSVVKSGGTYGINGYVVDVEVNISQGLPQFTVVGLPDTAVKESRERVRSAIENIGYKFPVKKITVNLAPADVLKIGTLYDLPISIGILASSGIINENDLKDTAFIGELALNGDLRGVKGVLPIAIKLKEAGFKRFIVPLENEEEAAIVNGLDVYGFANLKEIVMFLNGDLEKQPKKIDVDEVLECNLDHIGDFAEVKGQYTVKKALEIAAAGFHNLLMIGSPGSGKTMLARRFLSILPPLTFQEAIEVTKIHSIAGVLKDNIVRCRPFRAPHHTISDIALIGGGSFPKPGEVSLAHNGVLFLDELPEFKKSTLEVLRQPLEDKVVSISRASGKIEFPANFQLIAAANPCPCGYKLDPKKECRCTPAEIKRYLGKISGPLLDRIDLAVTVLPVAPEELANKPEGEPSAKIRDRVLKAVEIQRNRFKNENIKFNSQMTPTHIEEYGNITKEAKDVMLNATKRFNLTARSFHKVLKVARTIADLENSEKVLSKHVFEAINYKVNENLF